MTPYGETSASHVWSPITARTMPESATTTNAARAMLEYRVSAMAVRSRPRTGLTRTIRTSPPSQTAAAMMWRMSAIIASWWFASSPECPCVPIGTSAASARIATNSVAVHDRTAKASTVRTAPAIVVISHVGPSSVSTRNRPSCAPNSGPASIAGLNASTKVRNPVAAADTVKTAAEMDAASSARSNSRSPAFSVNSAVTSTPAMPAADRLTNSRAVGRPQRTNGPGSPIASGAAPPPYASAHVITASAATTRIAGPAARSAREFT